MAEVGKLLGVVCRTVGVSRRADTIYNVRLARIASARAAN